MVFFTILSYQETNILHHLAKLMSKKVVIVGGHGNVGPFFSNARVTSNWMHLAQVSLKLAKLLSSTHSVTSIIRNAAQGQDITNVGAAPSVISLEDDSAQDFAQIFKDHDVVYFSAGAGGKGGAERTKAVDYLGALKVFDAVELVDGPKPRVILVSAIDVRDESKIPDHYVGSSLSLAYTEDSNLRSIDCLE